MEIRNCVSTSQFIRGIQRVDLGYLLIGDRLTLLDFDLNIIHSQVAEIIDWSGKILISNSIIYALEDTLSPIIESSKMICVCHYLDYIIVGYEMGMLKIFHNLKEIISFYLHGNDISHLSMSNNILTSASTDGTINIMQIEELLQFQGFDEDTIDEHLSEFITCNVEVSIQYAKIFGNYLYVVTDMNQFSIWNLQGEKCIDFGSLSSYKFNDYCFHSIIDFDGDNLYCCLEFNEEYFVGIFAIQEDSLLPIKMATTAHLEVIRGINIENGIAVCASEEGTVVKYSLK
eukprot:NODE_461_length_7178_cov_0.667185.p3 type:complete len:287 gc:universal NODE_461_length_7178_cov_0.667185:1275-415(-)